jgi:hypothetical protein
MVAGDLVLRRAWQCMAAAQTLEVAARHDQEKLHHRSGLKIGDVAFRPLESRVHPSLNSLRREWPCGG